MSHLIPLIFAILLCGLPLLTYAAVPQVMLAKVYQTVDSLSSYVVTEKFDGVRGYWTGKEMFSRSGKVISLPHHLVNQLPDFTVEGELWLGYERFSELSGLIHQNDTTNPLWRDVVFKVFDAPKLKTDYLSRMDWLDKHLQTATAVHRVKGFQVADQAALDKKLEEVLTAGGEGLMLNLKQADYESYRTDAILKYKPIYDDEATIIGYTAGKGKYEGKVGALVVQWRDGRTFKIGSGLSDELRTNPPELNSQITFEYSGYTSTGLPRFARYLRPYLKH